VAQKETNRGKCETNKTCTPEKLKQIWKSEYSFVTTCIVLTAVHYSLSMSLAWKEILSVCWVSI